MENTITEFKVIETDDGFRIEIKGDKEQIKSCMGEFSSHKGRHHRRRRGFGWSPWAMHPMMWMKFADCWTQRETEPESENQSEAV